MNNSRRLATACTLVIAASHAMPTASAVPTGYVRQTLPVPAPPVALTFDSDGKLYAIGGSGFGDNTATMHVFAPDGTLQTSFDVVGEDDENFTVGGMTYDPVGDRLLVTDNGTIGQVYAVGKTGGRTTIASDLPFVAGIAVRSTGEILASTAAGFGGGGVYEIDRLGGVNPASMLGLDYAAGLAFDGDDLIVQDARSEAPYLGRLQRVPVAAGSAGLEFGQPSEILAGMSSSYGIVLDDDGDVFTTGAGGVFNVAGEPAAETLFYNNGTGANQFATGVAFFGGAGMFEPFAGPQGGVLAVTADGGFFTQDLFITLFTPALAEDFNSDGNVDGADLAIWGANLGIATARREQGDANGDGNVDGGDFLRWQQASGATLLLPGATPLAVPEPTAWQVLALAALNLLGKSAPRVNVKRA